MLRELFSYFDFNYITPEGVSSVWTRVHATKVPALRELYAKQNIFTSIQMFKADQHEEKELQFTPIFFDLDYKDNVEIALIDARQLVDYFSRMDIPQEHIRVYFSGSKGFHVVVSPELFGIRPHEEGTYIVKNACFYVAASLQLRSFDTRVYSIRRMWRLPESIHQKTGLYCTELTHRELNLDIDAIREVAKGVQITGEDRRVGRAELWEDNEYKDVEVNPICQAWFTPFAQEYELQKELRNLKPTKPITAHAGENPVCITDLLSNSIRKEGTRNQGEMALVSYFKDTGTEEAMAFAIVNDWATKIPKGLTSKSDKRQLEADVKGVVKTVYDPEHGKNYHFACQFIRALGVGTDKPIACAYEKCKFVSPEDQEPEKPIELKLPEATRASYINKRFVCDVMIAGKDETPYAVPSETEVTCKVNLTQANSICLNCAIASFGGSYKQKFTAKNRFMLNMIDISDHLQMQIMRKRFGIPDKCPKHRIKVISYINIIEVMLVPRIDFTPDTITQEEPYVVRKGYYLGHDIEPNKEYRISAYTYPDPKTQHLVHVIDAVTPLTDDIIQFKATPEILESLKKFQVIWPEDKK